MYSNGILQQVLSRNMAELGAEVSALEIARHYRGFIDALIIDEQDADHASQIADMGMEVSIAQTVMRNLNDRIELAKFAVNLAADLRGRITG